MNHWDVIRVLARRMHAEALKLAGGDPSAEALLSAAAQLTHIPRQGLPAGHPLLYRAEAVLHSEYVWFNRDVELWQARFNQAHEYGHHWRHGEDSLCFESDIDAQATEDAIKIGEERVDGYGPHERRELEANVFAREFLLPGDKLREWYLSGENAETIAAKTGTHISMVIHQLARALLGTELAEPEESIPVGGEAGIELDKSQQAAARAGEAEAERGEREPPVLVDAGPGTGKTRTLVARIVHLLKDRSVHPSQILALTYSNKAADEMYSRVRSTATQDAGHVWMGTFHKFGLDLIRQYSKRLGIPPKPTVIDTVDAQLLLEQNLGRLELRHYRSLRYPAASLGRILSAISRAKDELVTADKYAEYAERAMAEAGTDPDARKKAEKALEVARVYSVYETLLAEKNYLDYGDLLVQSIRLLEGHDDVRERLQEKYRHILVDEYQDVNTASRLLVNILADDGDGLWVVGDLRQAIYRFIGAAPVNMRLLATEDFPDTKIIPLKTNYRSQQPVVRIFTACATRMRAMKDREPEVWETHRKNTDGDVRFRSSFDEDAEAAEMAEEIERLRALGVGYRDQAVLCRRHDSLCHFSKALEQSGIPVLYLGNFFERPEIRDLLSLVSLAGESDGRALYRLAKFEDYGFSFKDVRAITTYAYERKQYFPKALQHVVEAGVVSEEGLPKLALLAQHFDGFGFITTPWVVLSQYLFVRSSYLRPLVADRSVQAQQKKLAIYQFLLLAYQLRDSFADEEGDKKRRFLSHVRHLKLNNEEKHLRQLPDWADDIDAVRMMTIHGAKGLEFKAVHLPTLSEGQFPRGSFRERCPPPDGMLGEEMLNWHDEEEECLFFVGLSRARDHLCLSRARQYNRKESEPSRLLKLVSEELPRASVRPPSRPDKAVRRLDVIADSNVVREFDERALATYKECPLEYYYRYVLGISDRRADSAFAQTYLCIHQVWQSIGRQFPAGRGIDWDYIEAKVEEVWAAHGPTGHAYEPDYRKEAEAIIRQTLEYHSATETRILRPEWKVPLKNGTVVVRPDYIEFVDDGSGLTLFVQHLHLGDAPLKPPTDDYYVLYDIAAAQAYPDTRRRIQAMYMSTGETIDINVSYNWRKAGLQNYEKAMRGIIQAEFDAHPKDKRCPYCPSYFNCPSMESM
ncbi:MAG TPA: ATP-dependent helicase [Pyrinomonadaceae bacterium]